MKISVSILIFSKVCEEDAVVNYEPGCIQPDPTDQLLELMKSVNMSESNTKTTKGSFRNPSCEM